MTSVLAAASFVVAMLVARPAGAAARLRRSSPDVRADEGGHARSGPRWRRARSPAEDGQASEPLPGPLLLDLTAAVLASGSSPDGAVRAVGAVLAARGDPRGSRLLARSVDLTRAPEAADPEPVLDALTEALRLAVLSGLPPAELVRRAAVEERRRGAATRRAAMRRLEVLLVLPVGLCLLPAFVLLGIAPIVIDLLAG